VLSSRMHICIFFSSISTANTLWIDGKRSDSAESLDRKSVPVSPQYRDEVQ
jgi:hypothetical protein